LALAAAEEAPLGAEEIRSRTGATLMRAEATRIRAEEALHHVREERFQLITGE